MELLFGGYRLWKTLGFLFQHIEESFSLPGFQKGCYLDLEGEVSLNLYVFFSQCKIQTLLKPERLSNGLFRASIVATEIH